MIVQLQKMEDVVVAKLGPFLGESMARAALEGHCRSLGFEGPVLDREQTEAILGRLRQGMILFVGSDKANLLVDGLRDDLNAGGASS